MVHALCLAATLASSPLHAVAIAQSERVIRPFDGKTLSGWKTKSTKNFWQVGEPTLNPDDLSKFVVKPGGNAMVSNTDWGKNDDFYSTATFGDARISLEVMVTKGSNSGIYVMGEYEVQVLDSFGNDANPGAGDMGAIYGAQPPKGPVYKAPGEWNRYDIDWQAPKFDSAGKKTQNAKFIRVVLNGRTIHENLEMPGPTPGGVDGKEKAKGPLMFQGNHGPVAYRNIIVRPLPGR